MTIGAVATGRDYPQMIAETDHVEPAPRRVWATAGGEQIFDTTRARYLWEWPYYPQYYIPVDDIDPRFLVDEHHEQRLRQGTARRHGLRAGSLDRPGTVRVFGGNAIDGVAGTARFDWDALDAWYEEDEQIFVHPRNPYVRVDALRSHRHVRASLEGVTRPRPSHRCWYSRPACRPDTTSTAPMSPSAISCPPAPRRAARTRASPAATGRCAPGDTVRDGHQDLAWAYDYPTRQLSPIAGLVAFYNEKIDLDVDGLRLPRARTHFFK